MNLIFLLLNLSIVNLWQQDVMGRWNTGKSDTIIETFMKDGKLYGKVISSLDKEAKIGNEILRNFQFNEDKWSGEFYLAKRNRLFNADLVITGSDMEITLYTGFRDRILVWKKINE